MGTPHPGPGVCRQGGTGSTEGTCSEKQGSHTAKASDCPCCGHRPPQELQPEPTYCPAFEGKGEHVFEMEDRDLCSSSDLTQLNPVSPPVLTPPSITTFL